MSRTRPDAVDAAPRVAYASSESAWVEFDGLLRELVNRDSITRVCEVGAGARPALPLDVVKAAGLEYTLVDVSHEELDKAPDGYVKRQADATQSSESLGREYDLVFSRLVAEHIRDPRAFHRNVHAALAPDGLALHFFATLYALPFVANLVLPEHAARFLLHRLQPHRANDPRESKFPALYRWCRGPTRRQIERFERIGYRVEAYHGFFGTSRYFDRFEVLKRVDMRLTDLLLQHPPASLTSFAHVLLRRDAWAPGERSGPNDVGLGTDDGAGDLRGAGPADAETGRQPHTL